MLIPWLRFLKVRITSYVAGNPSSKPPGSRLFAKQKFAINYFHAAQKICQEKAYGKNVSDSEIQRVRV